VPLSVEKSFAIDHPAALGHFPGNPIIPGAVLLDEVLQAVRAGSGFAPTGGAGCEIRSAKFLRPVRPGDTVLIRWSIAPNGEAKFECLLQGQPVLTGALKLDNR
jgi:3-hydroxyacyl-[acyl-carrier-protein] dehydratase